jgi:acetyltransferase
MDLNPLFKPKSIAVLGASQNDNSIGGRPIRFLKEYGYEGAIYPINPKYEECQGLICYPDIKSLPEAVDHLMVVVRAQLVPEAIMEAAQKGVKSAMIFSSGFAEAGEEGKAMQKRIQDIAREYKMPICGPNCQGFIDHFNQVTATFTGSLVNGDFNKGPVAFCSQSGAMGYHFYGMAQRMGLGFSYMVSTGNEAVLTTSDFLSYALEDKNTNVVASYMEAINDPERLAQCADLAFEKQKPLLVMKVGRSAAGSQAASSHTGSIAGEDRIAGTFLEQNGILRVDSVGQFFDLFKIFSNPKRLKGGNVGIVSISGGAGVVMADDCEKFGLNVVSFAPETEEALTQKLPYFGSAKNPVDLTAQVLTASEKFYDCLKCVADDPNTDAIVIFIGLLEHMKDILAPPIAQLETETEKPILVTWMACDDPIKAEFKKHGIPLYEEPTRCIYALGQLNRFREVLADQSERKKQIPTQADHDLAAKALPLLKENGKELDEIASKQLIQEFGIPATRDILVADKNQAAKKAAETGFPVVMKIVSPDVAHKADIGGVLLDIKDQNQAKEAFESIMQSVRKARPKARLEGVMISPMVKGGLEMLVGLKNDPVFGPVIMVGLGGSYVEVFKDVSTRVLPINEFEARNMLKELKAYKLLQGARGKPPKDIDALVDVLLKTSSMGISLRAKLSELDINPLLVFEKGKGVMALDALASVK